LTDPKWAGRALLLNLDNLSKVLELPAVGDPNPTVLVEAGIRIHELNDVLLAAGFALENMGAIAVQSVAGATQTGTHGTGKGLGSMSSQLVAMTLLLSNGTILNVSATESAHVFDAAGDAFHRYLLVPPRPPHPTPPALCSLAPKLC
jgi:FAD/FMN-containing dehydrogenase